MGEPVDRRTLLRQGAAAAALAAMAPLLAACTSASGSPGPDDASSTEGPAGPQSDPPHSWFAPAEEGPHERTWMSWPARLDVWGAQLPGIRRDVAAIARAIVLYEPVSMVVRPGQAKAAAAACGPKVDIVPMMNDDLWIRDMGPVFLVDGAGGLAGLDLNFNGWGDKQVHDNDAMVARRVLELVGAPRLQAPFVGEGGGLEFDGDGTVMATESSIVNANRNPGKTKEQLDAEIRESLGAQKVVWVPGVNGQDITDDHIDSLARFVKPGLIVVDQPADPRYRNVWARSEKQALRILRHAVDAKGRKIKHVDLARVVRHPARREPQHVRERLRELVRVQRRRDPARVHRSEGRRHRQGAGRRRCTRTASRCSSASTAWARAGAASTARPSSSPPSRSPRGALQLHDGTEPSTGVSPTGREPVPSRPTRRSSADPGPTVVA